MTRAALTVAAAALLLVLAPVAPAAPAAPAHEHEHGSSGPDCIPLCHSGSCVCLLFCDCDGCATRRRAHAHG